MTLVEESRRSASPGPARSTPARRPQSIRRTTTHDTTRPEGLEGPVRLAARGRDLRTGADGTTEVLDLATFEIVAGPFLEGTLRHVATEPPHPGIEALIGRSAYAGFRGAVEEVMPGERESGSVRYQLIDDLSTALMLSGRVLRAEGVGFGDRAKGSGMRAADIGGSGPPIDMCAGWVAEGAAVAGYVDGVPPLFPAVDAPLVEPDDDPLAWHEHSPMSPHSTRRRRRLDVWREDGLVRVDSFFRDSHADGTGRELVVHEYSVWGAIDPVTLEVVSCDAAWGDLPFPECPAAASSAERVVGVATSGLRRHVLKMMVGVSTCTHLNDQLRSLQDVGVLLRRLDGKPAARP
jgi:hypothetical protein